MNTPIWLNDQLITQKAEEFANNLKQAIQKVKNEEDIKIATELQIQQVAKDVDIELEAKYEFTVAKTKGRIDSAYDRVFIEYKNPNSKGDRLSARLEDTGNQKVIEQIKSRFSPLQKDLGHPPESLFGVGFDGHYFIFVRYRQKQWDVQEPIAMNKYSVARFLRVLFNLGISGKPFVPDYLAQDFGAEGSVAQAGIKTLYQAIFITDNLKAQAFFRQWKILFGQVCGYDVNIPSEKITQLAEFYGITEDKKALKAPELLFAVHSYYALLIKLIAAEIVVLSQSFATSPHKKMLRAATSQKLKQELEKLETGSIFKDLGIINFLEGDLFAWYLPAWNEDIEILIRAMVNKLDEYNPATLSEDPASSRDLLKKLYQQLFPKSLRHDLGEYYTPDWLAEHTLNRLQYDGNPDRRLLDPSCGSGTFLVMAITRIRAWYEENRENCPFEEGELCQKILSNVIGFDLNPLAVMAARTNYLVAIRDLIRYVDRVEIPVYLCDSIMTPSNYGSGRLLTETGLAVGEIGSTQELKTSVANFYIPTEITGSLELISQYVEILEFCVKNDYSPTEFIQRCQDERLPVALSSNKEASSQEQQLTHSVQPIHEALYRELLRLDQENQNGIWARIIKNAFAPLFIGKVDFIIGNPPWVNWESLPANYRDSMKPLWQAYGLFSLSGAKGRLGGGKKDLSMLFVYSCIDNYLSDSGYLGFVITQSIFKSQGAGDGFRQFEFTNNKNKIIIQPLIVDDLSKIQVFDGATNRTAVFICQKTNQSFNYPIPYKIWQGTSRINQDISLAQVNALTSYQQFGALPVQPKKINSPWLTAPEATLSGLQKILGKSNYQAYAGCCTWLNGVYWINIIEKLRNGDLRIENLYNIGDIKVEQVETVIESKLVYPLLRGRDVIRWQAEPSIYLVMPQDTTSRMGIAETETKRYYPKTFAYFKQFEQALRKRSGYRRYFQANDPFYSLYNVNAQTISPYKVVWREQSADFQASVVISETTHPPIPDHKLMLVSCSSAREAYYLSALLNSAPCKLLVFSYAISTSTSTHVLDNIAIPKFLENDSSHLELATLSEQCHDLKQKNQLDQIVVLEAQVDLLAAKLWKLNKLELKTMQTALNNSQKKKKV
jgi:hypothetical protein